jgi:PTH1 family peptidyl-tRNA hydrolase
MKRWIKSILSRARNEIKKSKSQQSSSRDNKSLGQKSQESSSRDNKSQGQKSQEGSGRKNKGQQEKKVGTGHMYIIVGLGNPGREYENTRHNVGFMTLDQLAKAGGIDILEKKHKALIGKGMIDGKKVVLAKPMTYMNLSGESVRELVDFYKIDETAELIVISDDVSLPPGQLRVRKKGSAGGHNGLKNIILHLGHDQFIRLRMGVGEKPAAYDMKDYVLGHFTGDDKKLIDEAAKRGADCIRMIMDQGPDAAMNSFNASVKVPDAK